MQPLGQLECLGQDALRLWVISGLPQGVAEVGQDPWQVGILGIQQTRSPGQQVRGGVHVPSQAGSNPGVRESPCYRFSELSRLRVWWPELRPVPIPLLQVI